MRKRKGKGGIKRLPGEGKEGEKGGETTIIGPRGRGEKKSCQKKGGPPRRKRGKVLHFTSLRKNKTLPPSLHLSKERKRREKKKGDLLTSSREREKTIPYSQKG